MDRGCVNNVITNLNNKNIIVTIHFSIMEIGDN